LIEGDNPMTKVQPIPPGYHTVTPHLVVFDAKAALAFYERAFGAVEIHRMPMPDGRIMHAAIKIGDSHLMLCDEFREYCSMAPTSLGGSPVSIHLYVENVDEMFEKAVLAGATITMPPQEMFWGDRYGKLTDPYGHQWSLATHTRDLTPEEIKAGAGECMKAEAVK
jgi:PhnB protein